MSSRLNHIADRTDDLAAARAIIRVAILGTAAWCIAGALLLFWM